MPCFSRYASCASASYGATTKGTFSFFRAYSYVPVQTFSLVLAVELIHLYLGGGTHLDQLIRHLRGNIKALGEYITRLTFTVLPQQHFGTSEVLIAPATRLCRTVRQISRSVRCMIQNLSSPFTILFSSLLRRQLVTIEHYVRSDAIMLQHADPMHRIGHISTIEQQDVRINMYTTLCQQWRSPSPCLVEATQQADHRSPCASPTMSLADCRCRLTWLSALLVQSLVHTRTRHDATRRKHQYQGSCHCTA